MGRNKRGGQSQKKGLNRQKKTEARKGLPEEFEDEIDAFHKSRDRVTFEDSDAEQGSEDLDDEAVYNLSEDEDDSEDEEENIRRLKEEAARVQKRLSVLRAGQDSDEEAEPSSEDEEDGTADLKSWGRKRQYYVREGEEDDVGEEEDSEYEREVERQQRDAAAQLRQEDYGPLSGDSSEDDSDEPDQDTLGHRARQAGEAVQELVEREHDAVLLPEEKKAAIMADAPVLANLLTEMQSSLDELRTRIAPLLNEVKGGQIATAEGLSYLEAKNHLLLHYIATLAFLVLLRAEGRAFQEHPAVLRVVELRALLDKIRPLDRRLAYQVDRLVSAVRHLQRPAGARSKAEKEGEEREAGEDPLQFRPKPEALQLGDAEGDAEAGGDGIYRPPRLNPVAMDDDPDKDRNRAERRREEHRRRKARQNEYVQDMVANFLGAPEEVGVGGDPDHSSRMRTLQDRFRHRSELEEDLFIRRNLSKEERKTLASHKRAAMSGGVLLEDLADDITGILQEQKAGPRRPSAVEEMWERQRVSQKFGADLATANLAERGKRSGDADLPFREPLSDRRARMDSVRALKERRADGNEDLDDFGEGAMKKGKGGNKKRHRSGDEEEEEDAFYMEVAKKAKSKKDARAAGFAPRHLPPPLAPEPATGARAIPREVQLNRGLTPSRPKATKNPRVRNRQKFAKGTKRRKGQVQEVRPAQPVYAGEPTGIKKGVSKSRRF